MRIFVQTENTPSASLRTMLNKAGFAVVASVGEADYTIHLEQGDGPFIIVDGVDSTLERHAINFIAELSEMDILLKRANGIQSDRSIRVITPPLAERAVEVGLFRAFATEMQPSEGVSKDDLSRAVAALEARFAPRLSWWKRLWIWLNS